MHHTQTVMGIPVSLDILEATELSDFSPAFKRLEEIDYQFSAYKSDSELSRHRSGFIAEADLSPAMHAVMQACQRFAQLTEGYFSAYYDGTFDPTGYVKGWAIQQAAEQIASQGFSNYLINAGGDIFGASDGSKVWNIGLQHPTSRQSILGTVGFTTGAVATSGTYERGQHVIDPHTRLPATELVSATVCGPEIIVSDVLATACLAMGPTRARRFIDRQIGYEVLLVSRNGDVTMTDGFLIN
ncbi:MAG: FAD:protein FMN transferase [Candidatus Saccharibacteria bacterium]